MTAGGRGKGLTKRPARTSYELTAATALPTLVAAALTALAMLTGNAWFLLLVGAASGLLVAARLVRPRAELALQAPTTTRVAVGDLAPQRLVVVNCGRRTSPGVLLTHEIAGLDPIRGYVPPLPPGRSAQLDLSRPAVRRGVSGVAHVHLDCAAPIGLLRLRLLWEYRQLLVVHPARVAPDAVARPAGAADEAIDPHAGAGLDVAGVRDYRPGDDPRHVHWRRTARRGALVVTERGTGPDRALRLLVVGPSSAPDWEALVATAASTCQAAQRAGRLVQVAAWVGLGPGQPAPTGRPVELLDWWAALDLAELPDPGAFAARLATAQADRAVLGGVNALAVSAHVPAGWWAALRAAAGVDLARVTPP